jgi:hypothetical protein
MTDIGKAKSDYVSHNDESALSGYLYKKTRDNRWQKRWFETNGVYLTYYKSRKMEKLLAALSLPQVGDIRLVDAQEDSEDQVGLFSLELNTRVYTLRAKSHEEAVVWVTTLTKLRAEGINAAVQQSKFPESRTVVAPDISSKEVNEPNTDWIKSGKTCFGCC